MSIVTTFRALSLVGLTIFWALLGLSFGLLTELLQPDHPRPGFQPGKVPMAQVKVLAESMHPVGVVLSVTSAGSVIDTVTPVAASGP